MKFNHVISCSGSLFILIADFHFVCLHDLLIILFIDICGLYFAAIMNSVAMNIMLHAFWLTHICISVELMPKCVIES